MKNKVYLILLLFIATLSMLQCKKAKENTETIVYGTITDAKTKAPIIGVNVKVVSYYWPYPNYVAASCFTDTNGKYALRFDGLSEDDPDTKKIEVSHKNYEGTFTNINLQTTTQINFQLYK